MGSRAVGSFLKLGWRSGENILQMKHFTAFALNFPKNRVTTALRRKNNLSFVQKGNFICILAFFYIKIL